MPQDSSNAPPASAPLSPAVGAPGTAPISAPITAIVPARNEEAVLAACVASLARQPEIAEIIVVNDESTDGTAALLRRLQETIPRLRVVESTGVPPGWVGKNHAVWLGAQQARLPWLLFTDADAEHLPGAGARALRLAQEHDAALVSFSPAQVTHTWWEKALIPFVYCRLARRYSYAAVNDAASPAAAANGQFLLLRRAAYDAVGGHAGVAGAILEDVALAARLKAADFRLWFGPGPDAVRVRMYRSFPAMWEGWRKNLFQLMGSSAADLRRELLTAVPWIPSVLLLGGLAWPVSALAGLLLLLLRHATYAAALARNQFPVSRIFYYVPGVSLYAAVLLASWFSHARGRVSWKGREYPVGTPAAEGQGR
ncbi:MAG: glycosyltransferase [Acidobacteriia bacterium]|nr:glycosyltransferase [Terriglobia bacterium]